MSDATFTFRVDEGLKAEFANAAKAHDHTGAQLLRDFMRNASGGRQGRHQLSSVTLTVDFLCETSD